MWPSCKSGNLVLTTQVNNWVFDLDLWPVLEWMSRTEVESRYGVNSSLYEVSFAKLTIQFWKQKRRKERSQCCINVWSKDFFVWCIFCKPYTWPSVSDDLAPLAKLTIQFWKLLTVEFGTSIIKGITRKEGSQSWSTYGVNYSLYEVSLSTLYWSSFLLSDNLGAFFKTDNYILNFDKTLDGILVTWMEWMQAGWDCWSQSWPSQDSFAPRPPITIIITVVVIFLEFP